MKKKYYEILKLKPSASKSEIKSAYRRLAMKYHPDLNKSQKAHDMFISVNEAYANLIEENVRKVPVFKSSVSKVNTKQEELKKRMEWAKNYAKYKKIKEENIASISYNEIQNSNRGWIIPLFSWLNIGFALLIFLDFLVLNPSEKQINYSYDYMNTTNSTMVVYLESNDGDKQKLGEFAIDVKDVNKLSYANPKKFYCEFSPLFKEKIYISFNVNGEKVRIFNYQSTYSIFYFYLIFLLLPIINIVSKGPNLIYVFSCYIISSIVFFVDSVLLISLIS